jgi:hypothetical protein
VLTDLLFYASRDASVADPHLAALEFLRDRRVNRPGLVLLPLHGFGIRGAGLSPIAALQFHVLRPQWDLALTPQTNNMRDTLRWLDAARTALGVQKRVPTEASISYRRSRAKWLDHNPLLAVRVVNVAGRPYENQRLLMGRVRAATGLLALVTALQPSARDAVSAFSTSKTNNFETLNIDHYIVLSDPSRQDARARQLDRPAERRPRGRVRAHRPQRRLGPATGSRRPRSFEPVERAVREVYGGYLRHSFGADENDARGRAYRKAFESLHFYRRSLRPSGGTWASTVSLAIAFELLLTDHYTPGVTAQIVCRAGLLYRGVPYRYAHEQHVRDLFSARGAIVHRGQADAGLELAAARRTYVGLFTRLAPQLASIRRGSATPLRDLLGDVVADEENAADEA